MDGVSVNESALIDHAKSNEKTVRFHSVDGRRRSIAHKCRYSGTGYLFIYIYLNPIKNIRTKLNNQSLFIDKLKYIQIKNTDKFESNSGPWA